MLRSKCTGPLSWQGRLALIRISCHRCDVNDLPTLDAELYRNLMHLRDYQGDAADLALTFTVADSALGVHREVRPLSLRGLRPHRPAADLRCLHRPCAFRTTRRLQCLCVPQKARRGPVQRVTCHVRIIPRGAVQSVTCARTISSGMQQAGIDCLEAVMQLKNLALRGALGGAGGPDPQRQRSGSDQREQDELHLQGGRLPPQPPAGEPVIRLHKCTTACVLHHVTPIGNMHVHRTSCLRVKQSRLDL